MEYRKVLMVQALVLPIRDSTSRSVKMTSREVTGLSQRATLCLALRRLAKSKDFLSGL